MSIFPSESEFRATTYTEDLHSMVIRSHSDLEQTLVAVITQALAEPHELEVRKLTFPLKVDLAIALSALRSDLRPVLMKLNKIRNEFAHNASASLGDQALKDLINTIPLLLRQNLQDRIEEATTIQGRIRIAFAVAYFECVGAIRFLEHKKRKAQKLQTDIEDYFKAYPERPQIKHEPPEN